MPHLLLLAALALAAPAPSRAAGPTLPFPRAWDPEPPAPPHRPARPARPAKGPPAPPAPFLAAGVLPFTGATRRQVDGYMRMLDSDEQAERDRGTELLRQAGYAALPALRRGVQGGDAEVRRRCRRLLEHYFLIGPSDGPGGEARPMPPIYSLCGPRAGEPFVFPRGRGGVPLAWACHYLFLRASMSHRGGAAAFPGADRWWYCGGTRAEREATAEAAGWLLGWGVSRAWVREMLDEMHRRHNPHPDACPRPPAWMLRMFRISAD